MYILYVNAFAFRHALNVMGKGVRANAAQHSCTRSINSLRYVLLDDIP